MFPPSPSALQPAASWVAQSALRGGHLKPLQLPRNGNLPSGRSGSAGPGPGKMYWSSVTKGHFLVCVYVCVCVCGTKLVIINL